MLIQGAAFYEDTYVRTADGWRISATGYRRSFEYLVPTSDLPEPEPDGELVGHRRAQHPPRGLSPAPLEPTELQRRPVLPPATPRATI